MNNRGNNLIALLLVTATIDEHILIRKTQVMKYWQLFRLFSSGKSQGYVSDHHGEDVERTCMVANESRCFSRASLGHSFINLVLASFLLLY